MISDSINTISKAAVVRSKIADYKELVKFRLTLLVVFSCVISFAMASSGAINWTQLLILSLGGFLVVGSANGLNQIIEKEYDKLMVRTANRPVATNRMKVVEAAIASTLMGVAGVLLLGSFLNSTSAWLGIAGLISYAFIYTPLKRVSPIAVFVGAFPGAIAPMLGWVAVTGEITIEPLTLFAVQFFWQFPHFWSIAWILDDDYKRAGFKLLPSSGRSKKSALQIIALTLMLVPVGMMPAWLGFAGLTSAIIASVASIFLVYQTFKLFKTCSIADAKKLMFSSFIYLPLVQIAFLLDKV